MNSSDSTMKTISVDTPFNLKVVKYELDFSSLLKKPEPEKKPKIKRILIPNITINTKKSVIPPPPLLDRDQKRDTKDLVEELLDELYAEQRDWCGQSGAEYSRGSTSIASLASSQSNFGDTEAIERHYLESLDIEELRNEAADGNLRLQQAGERLAKHVRARDRLRREQKRLCGALSVLLRHINLLRDRALVVVSDGGETRSILDLLETRGEQYSGNMDLRYADMLAKPHMRLVRAGNLTHVIGPDAYNCLPEEIRGAASDGIFKQKLKNWLVINVIYNRRILHKPKKNIFKY